MAYDIDKLKLKSQGLIPLTHWNTLVDYVRSSLVTSFVGGAFARTPMGTQLYARGGGEEASAPIKPLQIILSSVTASGTTTNYLSLYPGTVGGIFPKVDGQFLWAMPSDGAGGFLEYPRMAYTLPETGKVRNVWLKVQCVAGAVVGAVCETGLSDAVPPVPANTAEFAYVLLGYIKPDGGIVQSTYGPLAYQLVFGLQSDQPFGHTFTFAP